MDRDGDRNLHPARACIRERREILRRSYGDAVGRGRHEISTPALILDLEVLRANIAAMADWTVGHAGVRPHAKVHKCPEIARMQMDAGAVGITTATVWEAAAMVDGGIGDVLLANEVIQAEKLDLLADLARSASITVALDSREGADALSSAATRAGVRFGAVVEVDVGMGRGGVRTVDEAREVAVHAAGLPGITVRGAMAWEGHLAIEKDRAVRVAGAAVAIDKLVACADVLRAAGIAVDIVSAGGTNTYDFTGADPRVTDIQAGSYVLMDTSYHPFSPRFLPALSVLGTVVSRHGSRAILDCGTKVLEPMLEPARPREGDATVFELHEEHALLDVGEGEWPRLGDRIELIASYCSGTVAYHDVYQVVEGDRVVDVWPILGRGPGPGSL